MSGSPSLASSSSASPSDRPRLWAFGGGKGGVGKTLVASSLAVAFARRGRRCVLVDADLGGANLHGVLGLRGSSPTLSEFLSGEVPALEDVACPTAVEGLRLVSGASPTPDTTNPVYARKQRLLRHLRRLDADEVLVDLAAGSTFNVLDLFLAADRRVLVVTPEPTSLDNAYQFLRAAWFRSLRPTATEPRVREALRRALASRPGRAPSGPRTLVADVSLVDPEAGMALDRVARAFALELILNQTETPEERRLAERICEEVAEGLGARLTPLACLDRDESVRAAVGLGRPMLEVFPESPFSEDVESLADALLPRAAPRSAFPPRLDLRQPGRSLQRIREALGLDLGFIRRRTRIRYLASLEAERYDELPPEPFLSAYVRTYAHELGIEESEELAACFVERSRARLGSAEPAGSAGLHFYA